VSLEGNALGDLDINGRIVTDDQQTVYELDGKWKEIEQVEELRYFFFTGNMSDMFNLKNRQLTEEAMLELDVNFKGTEHQFHTNVENVSTDMLIFKPNSNNYESDYYEAIFLMSSGLNMTGSIRKWTEEWVQPGIEISIILTDGTEIHLIFDTRGLISDEGFPVHSS